MQIEETSGPRFDLALELVQSGGEMSFRDVGFALVDGVLHVRAESTWRADLTDARAHEELERSRGVLASLLASPEFANLIAGLPVRLSVIHDDGMGAVELCWLENGRLQWAPGVGSRTV